MKKRKQIRKLEGKLEEWKTLVIALQCDREALDNRKVFLDISLKEEQQRAKTLEDQLEAKTAWSIGQQDTINSQRAKLIAAEAEVQEARSQTRLNEMMQAQSEELCFLNQDLENEVMRLKAGLPPGDKPVEGRVTKVPGIRYVNLNEKLKSHQS